MNGRPPKWRTALFARDCYCNHDHIHAKTLHFDYLDASCDEVVMIPVSSPKVSIGLPVYNGERYLAESIDSLLAQTYNDFELIITDNASTDATENICREYVNKDSRIRYFRAETNLGAAQNFNWAFEQATGEYFKWAADDDLHDPRFLEACVHKLDNDPEVSLCFTFTAFIDGNGASLVEHSYPIDLLSASRRDVFLLMLCGGHIVHEIFGLMRTETLKRSPLIGKYVGSDIVLLGYLALAGSYFQVPELLFFHREHDGRSAHAMTSPEDYARWFDTANSGKTVAPHWRRMLENTKTILGSRLSMKEKLMLFYDVCRVAYWNRHALWADLVARLTGKRHNHSPHH